MKPDIRTNSTGALAAAPRPLRVLVVDDDRDTVLTLMALLREEGHETKGVYNGRDALQAMRDFDADAVIMDIAMPQLSGWDTARQVREAIGVSPRCSSHSAASTPRAPTGCCRKSPASTITLRSRATRACCSPC